MYFMANIALSTESYDNLSQVLQEHFDPKPLVLAKQYSKHAQASDECIMDHVTELTNGVLLAFSKGNAYLQPC